jgi:hypothetical protein
MSLKKDEIKNPSAILLEKNPPGLVSNKSKFFICSSLANFRCLSVVNQASQRIVKDRSIHPFFHR